MKIIRGLDELGRGHDSFVSPTPLYPAPVATLGMFDGVHVGHQAILKRIVTRAAELSGTSFVLTFAQHPEALLKGRAPAVITPLAGRLRLIEQMRVDYAWVLAFDDVLAQTEPDEFVRSVLVERLGVSVIVVGQTTTFGRRGRGDAKLLRVLAQRWGFELEVVPSVVVDGTMVSSTEIRRAIAKGNLARAFRMLGRPVAIMGTVVHATGVGRQIGFPTANLDLHQEVHPPPGVYVSRTVVDGRLYHALTNVGLPHAEPLSQPPNGPEHSHSIEVHVLDFDADLYGRELEVELIEKVRDEIVFENTDELRRQIGRDVGTLRARLERDNQTHKTH